MREPVIRSGISTCLLGERVRYDGGHKLDRFLVHTLGQYVEWVPVCPEVEMGLPIPRESMWLIGDPETPHLVTVKSGTDYTDRMIAWARERLEQLAALDLCGFVFKKDSPQPLSCFPFSGRNSFPSAPRGAWPPDWALALGPKCRYNV
jgi:uncharacterized protein YbbK (DUF523 family)